MFGAGAYYDNIIKQNLKNDINIVAFIDNDIAKQGKYKDKYLIIAPDKIKNYNYDYIVVTSQYYKEIYIQLIELGVKKNNIICFEIELFNEYIKNPTLDISDFQYNIKKFEASSNISAICTGISYMKFSIHPELMQVNTFNFSLPSQDILYDYYTVKFILENYHDKIKGIKYAIIGLAYYSFDYNISKSKFKYMIARYTDKVKPTESLNKKAIAEKKRIQYLENAVKTILINKAYYKGNDYYDKNINCYWNSNPLVDNWRFVEENEKKLAQKHSKKLYANTENENKKIMKEYLVILKKFKIKPIILINPVNKCYYNNYDIDGRNRFYKILHEVIKESRIDVKICDYFFLDIFENTDYVDGTHLNNKGARKFTEYLNETNIFDI